MRESHSNPSKDEEEGPTARASPRAGSPSASSPAAPTPPLRVAADNPQPEPSSPPERQGNSVQAHQHLIKRQTAVLQLIAEFIDQDDLHTSLRVLTGELQNRFRCERVAIGLYDDSGELSVEAISQQADFDTRSVEIRLLTDAMVEACDQDTIIHHPGKRRRLRIVDAHRTLAAGVNHAEICTLPLCHQGRRIGALLLQRTARQPWSPLTLKLFREISLLLAPMVMLRQQNERSVAALVGSGIRRAMETLLRPRHLLVKSITLLLISLLVTAHFTPVTHRITAEGELVPTERRVVTAPIMGYVEAVNVRPGERVTAGDVMLQLDTRDLKLERTKWENEIRSTETEFRSAMAGYDRKAMAIAQARQRQARAQLDLVTQQISRASVTAPADGIVVSGDLTQALGAPVERGEELLEIAPGEGYEIHLYVDEKDISYIAIGQSGSFTLAANPSEGLPFRVKAIRPMAQAREGRNVFQVETVLSEETGELRPGQTGAGKVAVGEASLLWVWTHRFSDWLRLKAWVLAG